MKMPSQATLLYETSALSNDAWTDAGTVNLPKDLSIVNRRGYSSTDLKGVPWCFRVQVTGYQNGVDGAGLGTAAVPSDFITTMKFLTCQNNWVMKNAAVKWHAARNAMWKNAGIRKRDLGAYAGAIRYNFDENDSSGSWAAPLDGDGNAFVGGTWDASLFASFDDPDFSLKLLGIGVDEDSTTTTTAYNIGHSYLGSRATVPADSNIESSLVPADESILVKLLAPGIGIGSAARRDDIADDVQDGQDNPPYDEFVSSDTNHDITEPVEAGRILMTAGATVASTVFDVPFGIFGVAAQHYDHADTNITDAVAYTVKVIDIYPMQG
jgi:hypothetical protein